jgi:hypothetical protein
MLMKSQIQSEVTSLQERQLTEEWKKANLEKSQYVTGDMSSTKSVEIDE